ncbi:hypothetical protein Bhyg_13888, partial [Pseudolycoriella hygida]
SILTLKSILTLTGGNYNFAEGALISHCVAHGPKELYSGNSRETDSSLDRWLSSLGIEYYSSPSNLNKSRTLDVELNENTFRHWNSSKPPFPETVITHVKKAKINSLSRAPSSAIQDIRSTSLPRSESQTTTYNDTQRDMTDSASPLQIEVTDIQLEDALLNKNLHECHTPSLNETIYNISSELNNLSVENLPANEPTPFSSSTSHRFPFASFEAGCNSTKDWTIESPSDKPSYLPQE